MITRRYLYFNNIYILKYINLYFRNYITRAIISFSAYRMKQNI